MNGQRILSMLQQLTQVLISIDWSFPYLRRSMEGIWVQNWLNHDKRIRHIFAIQDMPAVKIKVNTAKLKKRKEIHHRTKMLLCTNQDGILQTCNTLFHQDCYWSIEETANVSSGTWTGERKKKGDKLLSFAKSKKKAEKEKVSLRCYTILKILLQKHQQRGLTTYYKRWNSFRRISFLTCGYKEKFSAKRNELGSSLLNSPNFWDKRMSILSSHRNTSGPSSVSALNTAIRLIITHDVSWSKPRETWAKLPASTQFLAHVVTRILRWPLECWYCVINWMQPRDPWGTGAVC